MSTYSKEIAAVIDTFLTNDDWKYYFDEDKGQFRFGLRIDGKIKNIQYIVAVHRDSFSVFAISPINADEDNQEEITAMAQFLCQANYGLRNGNFELDVRDGEIRYKVFQNCSGGLVPNEEIVRNSIYVCASMFERYSQGIVGIIYGGLGAKKAIDLCEGRAREHRTGSASGASGDDATYEQLRHLLAELKGESAQGTDGTGGEVGENATEGEDGEGEAAGEESGGGSEEDAFETTLRLLREALSEGGEEDGED